MGVDESERPIYAQSMGSAFTSNSAYFDPVSRTRPSGGSIAIDASTTPLVGSRLTGGSRVGGTTLAELRRRLRKETMLGYSFS